MEKKALYGIALVLIGFILLAQIYISSQNSQNVKASVPVLSEFDRQILGSRLNPSLLKVQHIHADFAVFVNGQQFDFSDKKYFLKSAFMHVETDDDGSDGKKLHMHSTNVPLWVFLESEGLSFNSSCVKLDKEVCGNVTFFVNEQENREYENYVFSDGDRMLITLNPKDLKRELGSVTSFSKG